MASAGSDVCGTVIGKSCYGGDCLVGVPEWYQHGVIYSPAACVAGSLTIINLPISNKLKQPFFLHQ